MASVRAKQTGVMQAMFASHVDGGEPTWKVLVYDAFGRDILSPVLSQVALRDLSVVSHFFLNSTRLPIPDAPAVYFVMPSEENIKRICQDCEQRLYDSFELNFITEIPHRLLELLASSTLGSDSSVKITKVFDVYSNFISLEENMFIMRQQSRDAVSYAALNNPSARDSDIEGIMKEIVDSLFSVLVTLSVVPIIRCSRRNAAEDIARRLDQRLREHLGNARNTLFADSLSGIAGLQRPVLVLLDRNIDLSILMHHTWTYQALVHDLLDLKLNRVTLKTVNASNVVQEKQLDLDKTDRFWGTNRGRPFPTVATAVEEDLQTFKTKEAELRRLRGNDADDDTETAGAEASVSLAENTAKIANAVASLPELLAQKRFLDIHTNLLTSVMDHIKQRQLDSFYEIEDELIAKKPPSRPVLELVSSACPGTLEDKLRLLIIYYLSNAGEATEEIAQLEAALREQGADTAAMEYLKRLMAIQQLSQPGAAAKGQRGGTLFSHATKLLQTGNHLWKQGVKALLPTTKDLPTTKIVESLMELKPNPQTDEYLYFDPKQLKGSGTTEVPKGRAPFDNAIVFMVGGGNYIEYQNLCDFAERSMGKKNIIYGTTDLVSAGEMLKHLTTLGHS